MADDVGDVVFLEEADGGDSGGSRFEASLRIFQGHAAERQDRSFVLASLSQIFETCGVSLRGVPLLENRREQGEVSTLGGCLGDLRGKVARDANGEV